MEEKKFQCLECAGLAKQREEECSTCDGEGNPKVAPKAEPKKLTFKKAKRK